MNAIDEAKGLDTFKLGHQPAHERIGMCRDCLKRHAGHDDKLAMVKTVQSA